MTISFRPLIRGLSISSQGGTLPHPSGACFRPLIRGLSISSSHHSCDEPCLSVSVPSSGDYQFLLEKNLTSASSGEFPSPHPGIINFFTT